nr:MLO protein homolog 1-like [Coffea arabica]
MAEGSGNEETTLEHTSTWAVVVVCFILIAVSILIEHGLHLLAKVGVYWRHLVPFSKCGFQNLSLRNMELLMFKENARKVLYWCKQLSH